MYRSRTTQKLATRDDMESFTTILNGEFQPLYPFVPNGRRGLDGTESMRNCGPPEAKLNGDNSDQTI